MKVSNRVKRNIYLALGLVGIACILSRAWDLAMDFSSLRAWFKLVSAIVITWALFDRFRAYGKRVQ